MQFHENPAVIARWQVRGGRALQWWALPQNRRRVLAAIALVIGCVATANTLRRHAAALPVPTSAAGIAAVVLLQFALLYGVYRAAAAFKQWPSALKRHPQWLLHGSYWGLLALLWATAPAGDSLWRAVLLGLALIYPALLWRLGYLLLAGQHGRMAGTRPHDHLIYLWPAWGGSDTPYGKGLAYLSSCEAKTPEALARSQLAGLKLLLLAVLWRGVLTLYDGLLYGNGNSLTTRLGLSGPLFTDLSILLAQRAQGASAPAWREWVAIYGELFEHVLQMAIKGHLIVGALRLYGFHVFRNSYKPLLAESVVEFWNRYFYYFKELLSTFFFLPTFTGGIGKRLRHWPWLRLLAAVFAAAFVGNVYYHLVREAQSMALGQVWETVHAQRSRMFYCALLALGIFVSMWREQRRAGRPHATGRLARARRIFTVWTFFAIITIWNTADSGFMDRVRFFLGLFGWR